MKNKRVIGFIVAASLAVGSAAIFAQQDQSGQSSQTGQEQQSQTGQSQQDTQVQPPTPGGLNEAAGAETGAFEKEKFIKDAAQGNVAEINIGQLATQKAQDPVAKELGQKLVTDHSKANEELKELAQKENIMLSTEPNPKQQKMLDQLSSLSGAEFDKAFAQHAVQDHKKDIAEYKKAAAKADDASIRDYAKNTLPALEEHLKMAQQLAPGASAGAAVEEPAGAEKKQEQQPQDQNQQNQIQTPDAGQATPK